MSWKDLGITYINFPLLSLRNGGLSGLLPPSWSSLVNMANMDLSGNKDLSGGIPPSWSSLANKTLYITLDGNPLMWVGPPWRLRFHTTLRPLLICPIPCHNCAHSFLFTILFISGVESFRMDLFWTPPTFLGMCIPATRTNWDSLVIFLPPHPLPRPLRLRRFLFVRVPFSSKSRQTWATRLNSARGPMPLELPIRADPPRGDT